MKNILIVFILIACMGCVSQAKFDAAVQVANIAINEYDKTSVGLNSWLTLYLKKQPDNEGIKEWKNDLDKSRILMASMVITFKEMVKDSSLNNKQQLLHDADLILNSFLGD